MNTSGGNAFLEKIKPYLTFLKYLKYLLIFPAIPVLFGLFIIVFIAGAVWRIFHIIIKLIDYYIIHYVKSCPVISQAPVSIIQQKKITTKPDYELLIIIVAIEYLFICPLCIIVLSKAGIVNSVLQNHFAVPVENSSESTFTLLNELIFPATSSVNIFDIPIPIFLSLLAIYTVVISHPLIELGIFKALKGDRVNNVYPRDIDKKLECLIDPYFLNSVGAYFFQLAMLTVGLAFYLTLLGAKTFEGAAVFFSLVISVSFIIRLAGLYSLKIDTFPEQTIVGSGIIAREVNAQPVTENTTAQRKNTD
jgi:hypothetical protein